MTWVSHENKLIYCHQQRTTFIIKSEKIRKKSAKIGKYKILATHSFNIHALLEGDSSLPVLESVDDSWIVTIFES